MREEKYHLAVNLFNMGDREWGDVLGRPTAIKQAKKLIRDGFDKVTIYDEDGVVTRTYYNVNGQARRL